MTLEARYLNQEDVYSFTAPSALVAGQVVQLPNGKAGVIHGNVGYASGEQANAQTCGLFKMAKTTSMVVLQGQQLFWDIANSKAKYTGDFYIGTAVEDAAAAATEVTVDLNAVFNPRVALNKGTWTTESALGLGVVRDEVGGEIVLAFDAVAEIAQAALISDGSVAIAQGPIVEGLIAIYDIGNNAALDINFGMANASHATDFDEVTEAVVFHLDGNALSILAESDDGTTEVAATDTTVDAVDDTYAFFQIDARDPTDVQLYINGVNVLPASVFSLEDATGPMKAIVHMEKTSDDTTADVRVKELHIRTGVVA